MRNSWPDLEDLTVAGLKSADDGPMWELDQMWAEEYESDEEEDEEVDESVKRTGLTTLSLLDPGACCHPTCAHSAC